MEPCQQQNIIKAQLSSLKSKPRPRRSFTGTEGFDQLHSGQPQPASTDSSSLAAHVVDSEMNSKMDGSRSISVEDQFSTVKGNTVEDSRTTVPDNRPVTIIKWTCSECSNECIPVMRESRCLCGHRMKEHRSDPKNKLLFPCASRSCKCSHFFFLVAEGSWILRCRCKHKHIDHDAGPGVHKCSKCSVCSGFDSPWVCNCGHTWASHVQQSITVTKDKSTDETGETARFEKKQHFYRQDGIDSSEV